MVWILHIICIIYIYIYIYIWVYCIHHWRILWSIYRKLNCVGFEPIITEFRSDALTYWAISSWVQLALRANFVLLLLSFRLLPSSVFMFVLTEICLRYSYECNGMNDKWMCVINAIIYITFGIGYLCHTII